VLREDGSFKSGNSAIRSLSLSTIKKISAQFIWHRFSPIKSNDTSETHALLIPRVVKEPVFIKVEAEGLRARWRALTFSPVSPELECHRNSLGEKGRVRVGRLRRDGADETEHEDVVFVSRPRKPYVILSQLVEVAVVLVL